MDYNELVSLINSIQAQDTEVRTVVADVYDLGSEVEIKEYMDIETAKFMRYVNREEGTPAQQQKAADSGSRIHAQQRSAQPPIQPAQQTPQRPRISEDRKAVAKELETMMAEREKAAVQPPVAVQMAAEPAQSSEKLVLPSLSLQDQTSELEKIGMGLDRKAFDQEQIGIIKKEVAGLRQTRSAPVDDFQKGLVRIRDARLSEVMAKLGM